MPADVSFESFLANGLHRREFVARNASEKGDHFIDYRHRPA